MRFFQGFASGHPKTAAFGAVVQGTDGQPLPDAFVTLSGARPQRTEVEGRVRWNELAPGRYTVTASRAGLVLEEPPRPVELVSGACVGECIRLVPPHRIQGTLHGPGDRPASNVPVRIRESNSGEVLGDVGSDANGQFTISRLAAGSYRLTAGDQPPQRSPYPAQTIAVTVPGPNVVVALAEPAPTPGSR